MSKHKYLCKELIVKLLQPAGLYMINSETFSGGKYLLLLFFLNLFLLADCSFQQAVVKHCQPENFSMIYHDFIFITVMYIA
jgi:hypothetical protein